jgi:peroxiredoxin
MRLYYLLSLFFLSHLASAQVRQYVETARPEAEIRKDYPYDIQLRDAAGASHSSAEVLAVNGKPTVLMFWLTTCGPCRLELAALAAKYEAWKSTLDFNLYAISIDFPHNYEQFVNRVQEGNWPFPAYLDLNREFGVIMPGQLNGLPQTFVLDRSGHIVLHKRKYAPGDEDELLGALKQL